MCMSGAEWAIAVGAVFFFGVGLTMTTSGATQNEFLWAKACFIFSGLLLVIGYCLMTYGTVRPMWLRVASSAVMGGLALVLVTELIGWVAFKEQKISVSQNANSTSIEQAPDVSVAFVYPEAPALVLVNNSQVVAKDIKYWSGFWNLDSNSDQPLPIPVAIFDWIRPNEVSAPQAFFTLQNIAPLISKGNRLVGLVGVTCPTCLKVRLFWVYVLWGSGGWYSETDVQTDWGAFNKTIPEIAKDPDKFFSGIPEASRIKISE